MFCSSVHFFPTAPTFSSHVFCSCFFRQHQNFPFTWCSAVLFFRQHKFSIHVVFCSPFFRQHKCSSHVYCSSFFSDHIKIFHYTWCSAVLFFRRHKFSSHVYCNSFFSDSTKIFQPRVASFKLADISTTCDVVYFSFHGDCSSDVFSGYSKTYSLWEISKILQLKSEYVISHVFFSMM